MRDLFDLTSLRKAAKLRVKDVAYELDVSDATVRNWEKGRSVPNLSPTQYVKILKLYACTAEEFDEAFQASAKQASPDEI